MLRDAAHLIEGLLNHELPSIMGEPPLKKGERLHSWQERSVTTAVGPIRLRRAYYRGPRGGRYPLDEILELHEQYTPSVVQLMCWAGAMDTSFELASETLRRFAGLDIPGRQIQRVVNAFGPQAAKWMDHRSVTPRQAPVEILNIQTDMTGIPARPGELQGIKGKQPDGTAKTRQIKVGCVFTQSLDAQKEPQRDPLSSTYLAAFCDRVQFGHSLWKEALKQGYASARTTVFLGDGAEWIWNIADDRFANAVQIVDFYHACEHLHALCSALEPDETKAKGLYEIWRARLKNNGLPRILKEAEERIATLRPHQRPAASAQLPYFQNNAHRMKYGTFRKKGYFIGSGAVEGACRHIVAQRAKLSGMRWSCAGAENVLAFRCLIKSNIFDEYCKSEKRAA